MPVAAAAASQLPHREIRDDSSPRNQLFHYEVRIFIAGADSPESESIQSHLNLFRSANAWEQKIELFDRTGCI